MAAPFSVRLSDATIAQLEARASGTSEAPRTVAQRYIEEGLRQDLHPLIRFADGPAGRRAALVGTGLDVWEVIATVRDNGGDITVAANYLAVAPALVDAAVTYYGSYRDEIDSMITAHERAVEVAHESWLAGRRAIRE